MFGWNIRWRWGRISKREAWSGKVHGVSLAFLWSVACYNFSDAEAPAVISYSLPQTLWALNKGQLLLQQQGVSGSWCFHPACPGCDPVFLQNMYIRRSLQKKLDDKLSIRFSFQWEILTPFNFSFQCSKLRLYLCTKTPPNTRKKL